MPKLKRPIPETDSMITRVVALAVIQDALINRMGLKPDIKINFPGFAETVSLPRGLISSPNEDVRLPTSDKLAIEVSESTVNDWMPSTQTHTGDQVPCFLNPELELEMRPIYTSIEMEITLRYRAPNKTEARRFYNYMMMKVPDREDTWLHTLQYAYGIPDVYMAILEEIHRLTELQEGYGDDFETFFNKWVNPRFGTLTDQAGKNTMGAYSETQSRVIGYFDVDAMPDFGGKKDDSDVWEIEIPYKVRYDKPVDMYLSYPIVIHNSVIGQGYRSTTGMERIEDYQQSSPKSLAKLDAAAKTFALGRNYKNQPGRYYPLFDEFIPRNVPENTMRIFTALTLIDTNPDSADPLLLMNLADLEDPQYGLILNDCVKAFISSDHEFVTKPKQSAVHISLYMGRLLMDQQFIEVDENLNVRSKIPLNKRKYYHVRVSLITDLTWLSNDANNRLRKSPCMLSNLLEYVTPERTVIPKLDIGNGQVRPDNYEQIAVWLKNGKPFFNMKTVQKTNISAVYNLK